jgi:hypothetical protein
VKRALLLGLLLLLLPFTAIARDKTWCVGGYDGMPPLSNDACGQPAVRRVHADWHKHNYVTDGTKCYVCWDEEDASCQTDFLATHPGWSGLDAYECLRAGAHDRSDQILDHVIAGQHAAPPPPPPPTVLTAKLEQVSPGPYSVGDKVRVIGAVRDDHDAIRPVSGGSFVIDDGHGGRTTVPGVLAPNGTVHAEVELPSSDTTRITFTPAAPTLAPGEMLRAAASDPFALRVDLCAFRARVVGPAPGESLAAGQAIDLRAALFDGTGKTAVTPPPDAAIEFTITPSGAASATVPGAGLTARWTPPPSPKSRAVTISAGGHAGARMICPLAPVTVTVSDLGLGFDASGLPVQCYVGLRCAGEVRLVRPASGAARQKIDVLLGDAHTSVALLEDNRELSTAPARADDRVTFDRRYTVVGTVIWTVEVRGENGTIRMDSHEIRVRPALKLALPSDLDFGTVPAGTPWSEHCQKLDFSQSQAAEEHTWDVVFEPGTGCLAEPLLAYSTSTGQQTSRKLRPAAIVQAFDPHDRSLYICLDTPRCEGETPPAGIALKLTPRTPEFAAQSATVHLHWKVRGRPFYLCHAFWLGPLAGGLFGLFVLLGILRPARFPVAAAIRVAGSEKGTRTAAAIVLRECPGSSPGFYSDACLGLHDDGSVNGRTAGALVRLRAVRGGGVVLSGHGPVEVQDRRTRAWEPVDDLHRGHPPTTARLYRAGSTYFRVEGT